MSIDIYINRGGGDGNMPHVLRILKVLCHTVWQDAAEKENKN